MNLFVDRRAIRSLRVGVVPVSHVLSLSVGVDSFRNSIDRELKDQKSGHKPLIVKGEWGTGKSNLLCYLREYSLKRNIVVAYININGRSAAINHPQRFYHKIVSDLRMPGIKRKGIISLLNLVHKAPLKEPSDKWIFSNRKKSELAIALYSFNNGDRLLALQVILGVDLYWADYNYKKIKALKRINDLGSYLRCLGFDGLMLQFDELETMVQLWNILSRKSAYRILHYMSNFRNIWPVFATTEKLNSLILSDIDSGKLSHDAERIFAKNYFLYPVLQPPIIDQKLAVELLKRIGKLYDNVYQLPKGITLQQVLERWNKMAFNNPRRLIRCAIDHLDRQRPIKVVDTIKNLQNLQSTLPITRLARPTVAYRHKVSPPRENDEKKINTEFAEWKKDIQLRKEKILKMIKNEDGPLASLKLRLRQLKEMENKGPNTSAEQNEDKLQKHRRKPHHSAVSKGQKPYKHSKLNSGASNRCKVCGAIAIPGSDFCHSCS